MEQPRKEGLLKILWYNLQGDFRRSLKSGEFQGAVSVAASTVTRQVLVVTLGPLVGGLLSPLSDYVIHTAVPAVRRSWEEWVQGQYTVSTTKSGVVVLESPKLVAPRQQLATLPNRLEIPTDSFIKPTQNLLFNPANVRTSTLRNQVRPVPQSGTTAIEAFLSQGVGQTGLRPTKPRYLTGLNRVGPGYSQLTDIVYPSWVFGKQSSLLTSRFPSNRTPESEAGFWKWYMSDPERANQTLEVIRNMSNFKAAHIHLSWWDKLKLWF